MFFGVSRTTFLGTKNGRSARTEQNIKIFFDFLPRFGATALFWAREGRPHHPETHILTHIS